MGVSTGCTNRRDPQEFGTSLRCELKRIEHSLRREVKRVESSLRREIESLETSCHSAMRDFEHRLTIRLSALMLLTVLVVLWLEWLLP